MKIKIDNTLSHPTYKEIMVLPVLDIFWSGGAGCIVLGWLAFLIHIWFGDTKDI